MFFITQISQITSLTHLAYTRTESMHASRAFRSNCVIFLSSKIKLLWDFSYMYKKWHKDTYLDLYWSQAHSAVPQKQWTFRPKSGHFGILDFSKKPIFWPFLSPLRWKVGYFPDLGGYVIPLVMGLLEPFSCWTILPLVNKKFWLADRLIPRHFLRTTAT